MALLLLMLIATFISLTNNRTIIYTTYILRLEQSYSEQPMQNKPLKPWTIFKKVWAGWLVWADDTANCVNDDSVSMAVSEQSNSSHTYAADVSMY